MFVFLNIGNFNQSIIRIENLSSEIFIEIFDYLNALDIYEIFSNLNFRFQQLLRWSSLLLKLNCCAPIDEVLAMGDYQSIFSRHGSQLLSIQIWADSDAEYNHLISSFILTSTLIRLESFFVYGIE